MHKGDSATRPSQVRCAIYTRKSHEEGLDQEFNSLDAQREACEAYISSQKHEGWSCLSQMYDDGGISGATLERPALKRLLTDIEAGHIDTVVVYKVDRLTRSLADFAKIVEVFDARGASFVSVTQQFNTTTSMGRLTLNMLLSFAQFEREVTGERIRDKIAASKKKGMWMGGLPPLGYDVEDRKLVVNEAEASTVRHIFQRYLELGSVWALKEEIDRDGIRSKIRIDRHERQTGGKPLARGALYRMLQNRIYRGEIVHKENSYPGQHEAIVQAPLWEKVQDKLAANRTAQETRAGAVEPSLLTGLVFDETGTRMAPSHANKKGTRYRYYVSRDLIRGRRAGAKRGQRVPANDLETIVAERLCQFLTNEIEMFGALESILSDVAERMEAVARAAELATRWSGLATARKRGILLTIVGRIDILSEAINIRIHPDRINAIDLVGTNPEECSPPEANDGTSIVLSVPTCFKRTGMEARLLIQGENSGARRKPDHSLHRVLAQAHKYRELLLQGGGKSMSDLAAEVGVGSSYFTRILRLSFLSPDIITTFLNDEHPLEMTAKQLANRTQIPVDWEEQRRLLGIK